jgi:3-methyl-2-oxobutanoate hydroxymethyltransferase
VPVIGIGSGKFCDGQVQVLYDVIGISSNPPKFSKNYLTGSISIKDAIKEFYNYVKNIKN